MQMQGWAPTATMVWDEEGEGHTEKREMDFWPMSLKRCCGIVPHSISGRGSVEAHWMYAWRLLSIILSRSSYVN